MPYCSFLVIKHPLEVCFLSEQGIYLYLCHYRTAFAFSNIPYRHCIVLSLRRAYPNNPGNNTGLPSSAYLTNRVRFCLFAWGIVIHVAGTYNLLSVPLTILVIAYHRLSLFQHHDIYQQFTVVNHTG
jgi:hypothetical protein